MDSSETALMVGFCGYARSGKDTACEHVLKVSRTKNKKLYSFGDALRNFAYELNSFIPEIGMNYQDIVKKYGYEEAKDKFPSFREHLVKIGNGARKSISEDIWLNAVKEQIEKDGTKLALIKDVRYLNEAEFILQNNGIIIYIQRNDNSAANEIERKSIINIYKRFKDDPFFRIVKNDGKNVELFYNSISEVFLNLR